MSLEIDTKDKVTKLKVAGELGIFCIADYVEWIRQEFVADKPVECDLSAVDEIDTSGLQLLAVLAKQLSEQGTSIRFTGISEEVEQAFLHTRLLHALDCEPAGESS